MRQDWFSRFEVEDMIRRGAITDDSTIAAYLLYWLSMKNPADE